MTDNSAWPLETPNEISLLLRREIEMCKKNHRTLKVSALGFMLAASQASWSAQIFFGEDLGLGESTPLSSFSNASAAEASFLSRLIGVNTEDFEGFATNSQAPLDLNFPSTGTATLEKKGSVAETQPGATNRRGRYGTSGSKFWETSSDSFSISFSVPVAAFGFYGIDIGDFLGQVTISMDNGRQNYNVGNTVGGPGGSVLFWGVIDTQNPFTSISFGNTAAGRDVFGFDDITIASVAQVIPEPASVALLGLGLVGLGLTRRRRT